MCFVKITSWTIACVTTVLLGYAQYAIGDVRSTARSSAPGPFTAEELRFAKAAQKVCSNKGGTWERDGNSITCYLGAR